MTITAGLTYRNRGEKHGQHLFGGLTWIEDSRKHERQFSGPLNSVRQKWERWKDEGYWRKERLSEKGADF